MLSGIYPWGKSNGGAGWLSLEAHSLDVAHAFRGLALAPVMSSRLATAAGRPLSAVDVDRLCVLALLHDVGKANLGFARRIDPGAPVVGHVGPVATLLRADQVGDAEVTAIAEALGHALDGWMPPDDFGPWLAAVLSHHGVPLDPARTDDHAVAGDASAARWRPADGLSPRAAVDDLLSLAREQFPGAWDAGQPLPSAPALHHLFAGLLMAADWIGSSEDMHPLQSTDDPSRVRAPGFHADVAGMLARIGFAAGPKPAGVTPEAAVGEDALRPIQEAILDHPGATVVCEAETGSGKTEAALLRWWGLRGRGLVDGLYFALPTRVAAVEIHRRVHAFVGRVMGDDAARDVVLAVPGYSPDGGIRPPATVSFGDENYDAIVDDLVWAAQRPKRFLMARVAVGTVDQALLSVVRSRHAHMRMASLSRSLLVVDEVHASDAYATALTCALLDAHRRLGGHSLLLSATLGAEARSRLLGSRAVPALDEAVAAPYPSLSRADGPAVRTSGVASSGHRKAVEVSVGPDIADHAAVAALAVSHARRGARVLVIRNTVAGAVAVARAVEGLGAAHLLPDVRGRAAPHHGRFASRDRLLLDAAVHRLFGKGSKVSGRIVVGTQTLEQSLDIDADILLTDLCPADVLLQRMGRLHRHPDRVRPAGYGTAATVVAVPPHPLVDLVDSPAHGLGLRRAYRGATGGGVYPDLVVLEATRRLVAGRGTWTTPDDCRAVVETCLHPEARAGLLGGLSREDSRWSRHDVELDGVAFARSSAGRGACWSVAAPFAPWASGEAVAALTRLGGRDRRVMIPGGVTGPFGSHPGHLVVPHWMAGGIGDDDVPAVTPGEDGTLDIALGGRRYAYGRYGLETSDR